MEMVSCKWDMISCDLTESIHCIYDVSKDVKSDSKMNHEL